MKLQSIFISAVLFLLAHGVCGVGTDVLTAFVLEGDSVSLHTNVETKQQDDIKWYFKDTRIAQISGDLSFICTDVQCNEDTERFRDRLQLEDKTGSLTITDISTTDSGLYELKIINRYSNEKTFNITVHDVSAAERDERKRKSVKEGESVTLDPGVMKNTNDSMTWYFNDICITEINEEPRKMYTDARCKDRDERFILDHQTGSLTVINITNTDSGLYTLLINSSNSTISIIRIFSVTVAVSGLSAGQRAGICAAAAAGVLLLMPAFVCLFYLYKRRQKRKDTGMQHSSQANSVNSSPNRSDSPLMDDGRQKSSALVKNTTNGSSFNHNEIESEAANKI